MERILCVWFPDWPLRQSGTPPDDPAQAVGEDNRVTAVNETARVAGIQPGMRRREAEAVCPTVVTIQSDPGAEAARFEPVAVAVETIVPRVEISIPGLMFVPVTGALRYFGGEEPLVDRIVKEVEAVAGVGGCFGLAAGPFAARQAAGLATSDQPVHIVTDDEAFVESLDIGTFGYADMAATFRWLGIGTLGQLARLPRGAVASRFGNQGLEIHRLAVGEDRETLSRPVAADLAVEERFLPPLTGLEQAGFAARALAHRLMEGARADAAIPHRVEVEAESAGGVVRSRTWRSSDPFTEEGLAERVRWQLRAWVESDGIPGGLVRLRLVPADVSDRGRQMALHEDAATEDEARRALARAQALVGQDQVLQAGPQGGRDPGEQVNWHRWGEQAASPVRDPAAPWPGRLPGPAPSLVPPEPRPMEIDWDEGLPIRVRLGSRWEPVLSWAGPWRKTGRWWEGESAADRYQIVTSVGAFLLEVREGRGFLMGVYD